MTASDDDTWYAAFADEARAIHPGWNWLVDLTPEEELLCETAADMVASRPEAER